jgi:hypothetical protein
MNKDGLWAQLEKGANKVKSVSNKDIREAMEDLYRDIPNARHDDRQMVVMTGMAGAQAIKDAIKNEAGNSAHRFELKKLIFELEEMYKSGKVNTKRMKTLTTLLCSEDMSNFEMAKKIMKSL